MFAKTLFAVFLLAVGPESGRWAMADKDMVAETEDTIIESEQGNLRALTGVVVTGYNLWDATKDELIKAIYDGDVIKQSDYPKGTTFTIEAVVRSTSSPVTLKLKDEYGNVLRRRTENVFPYTLAGDVNYGEDNSDIYPENLLLQSPGRGDFTRTFTVSAGNKSVTFTMDTTPRVTGFRIIDTDKDKQETTPSDGKTYYACNGLTIEAFATTNTEKVVLKLYRWNAYHHSYSTFVDSRTDLNSPYTMGGDRKYTYHGRTKIDYTPFGPLQTPGRYKIVAYGYRSDDSPSNDKGPEKSMTFKIAECYD